MRVPAKINLALHVGATDADGYHELGTLFQAVNLFDHVTARPAPAGEFRLRISGEGAAFLPVDERNLATRAARLVSSEFGDQTCGVELTIKKRIPVAGGMAGGSADAAGALLACSVLWDLDTNPDELAELGARLGADVPFCLLGGTAIGTRRGDRLVPVLSRGAYHWVLAFSHHGLSTPSVFRRFDEVSGPLPTEVSPELVAAVTSGDIARVGAHLANDLQQPAIDLQPGLAETLSLGRAAGAMGAIVSGSGPTCAFLVESESAALRVEHELSSCAHVRTVRRASGPVPGAQLVT